MTEAWTDDATDDIPGVDDGATDDIPGVNDDATDDIPGVDGDATDDIPREIAGDESPGIPDEPEVFVEELEAEQVQPPADVPETGDARVDEVLSKLSGIEGRPTTEHVGVYDEVHRGLQDALANLDQG